MCGIVGYVGEKVALDVVVEGCDVWSTEAMTRQALRSWPTDAARREEGWQACNLEKLLAEEQLPRSSLGIGTRWATHGGPTDVNAHPHTSSDGRILVHNGIIENYVTLREELEQAGIICESETDTEIVAQLLGQQVSAGLPLAEAMRVAGSAPWRVHPGSGGQPGTRHCGRGAPQLPTGCRGGGGRENFVASDVAAFIEHTREAIELGQDQLSPSRTGSRSSLSTASPPW